MENMRSRDTEVVTGGNGSFSFSCYDFDSSPTIVFTEDDDESADNDYSDEESYIEIAIEPTPTNHYNYDDDDQLKLRISFSSTTLVLPQLSSTNIISLEGTDSQENLAASDSEIVTSSSSSVETCWKIDKNINSNKHKVKFPFPAVNRLLDTFMSTTTRALSEIGQKYGRPCDTRPQVSICTNNQRQLPHNNRNASKRTQSNMMMKFLIKFRSMNIRSLLASFVKTQQPNIYPQGNDIRSKKKTSDQRNYKSTNSILRQKELKRNNTNNNIGERSKVFEVKLDAIKGVLESIMSTRSIGCKDRRTKSCPTSSKSSPIHRGYPTTDHTKLYAIDNSVQAAIAHCKTSFGESPNFIL